MSLLGDVRLTRGYYHCPAGCGGHIPRDAALGLGADRLTRRAAEVVALAGVMGSFAEAATKTLPTLCGLRLGESTVERVVGMVWNPGEPGQVRCACGLTGGLAVLGDPLRRQAGQVGMDRADRIVAISDGGFGLEDWLRVHFPLAEAVIPDFWHAAQHLSDWAKTLHPDCAAEATRAAGEWCHRLKHEGGAAVLAGLRARDVGRRPAAKEAHRRDDPAYRAKGWMIGSGPVEAACKPVVNQRLKVTGARWSEAGADAVCHLRTLFRSELGQWGAYWASLAA